MIKLSLFLLLSSILFSLGGCIPYNSGGSGSIDTTTTIIKSINNFESSSANLVGSICGGTHLKFTVDRAIMTDLNSCEILIGEKPCQGSFETASPEIFTCLTPYHGKEETVNITITCHETRYTKSSYYFNYKISQTPTIKDVVGGVLVHGNITTLRIIGDKINSDGFTVTIGGSQTKCNDTISGMRLCDFANLPDPGFYRLIGRRQKEYGYAYMYPLTTLERQNSIEYQVAILPSLNKVTITNINSVKQHLVIKGHGFSTNMTSNKVQIENLECIVTSSNYSVIECDLDHPGKIRKIGDGNLFVGGAGLRQAIWKNATNWNVVSTRDFDEGRLLMTTEGVPVNYSYNDYVNRTWGFFIPDVTGEYTFETAVDDSFQASVSKVPYSHKDMTVVTYREGWTRFREFFQYPTSTQSINLEAGKPYYIDILFREDSGDDYFSLTAYGPPKTEADVNSLVRFDVFMQADVKYEQWNVEIDASNSQNPATPWYLMIPFINGTAYEALLNLSMTFDQMKNVIKANGNLTIDVSGKSNNTYLNMTLLIRQNRSSTSDPPLPLNITDLSKNSAGNLSAENIVAVARLINNRRRLEGNFTVSFTSKSTSDLILPPYQLSPGSYDWKTPLTNAGIIPTPTVDQSCEPNDIYVCNWTIIFQDPSQDWDLNIDSSNFYVTENNSIVSWASLQVTKSYSSNRQHQMLPITFKNLRTGHEKPQVTVEVAGMRAACIPVYCHYVFNDPNILPIIKDVQFNQFTSTLSVALENDADFVGMPLKISVAGVTCKVTDWIPGNLTCLLGEGGPTDLTSGSFNLTISAAQFDFSFINPSNATISVTPTITNATAAQVGAQLVYNISGTGFPNDGSKPVSVAIGTVPCIIDTINSTFITCTASIPNPSDGHKLVSLTTEVGSSPTIVTYEGLIPQFLIPLLLGLSPQSAPQNTAVASMQVSISNFPSDTSGVYCKFIRDGMNSAPADVIDNIFPTKVDFLATSDSSSGISYATMTLSDVTFTGHGNYSLYCFQPDFGWIPKSTSSSSSSTSTSNLLKLYVYACGNGIVEQNEECDDGNDQDFDGCSSPKCRIDHGFKCSTTSTSSASSCSPLCGDGIRIIAPYSPIEQCDDGNTASGDGCDSNCQVEPNWNCSGGSLTTKDTCKCSNESNVYSYQGKCLTMSAAQTAQVEAAAALAGPASVGATSVALGSQLLSLGVGATIVSVITTLDLIQLVMFCNVGYPPVVEAFFGFLSDNSQLIPNLFTGTFGLGGDEKYNSKWYRFAEFEVPVNFLDAAGDFVELCFLNLLLIAIIRILLLITNKNVRCTQILSKILVIFEWNNLLGFFMGSQINIAIALVIQIREPYLEDIYGVINFVLGVIFALVSIIVYGLIMRIQHMNRKARMSKYQQQQAKKDGNEQSDDPYGDNLQVLWEDFHINSYMGAHFLLVALLRNFSAVLIVYFFSHAPVVQSFFLVLLSASYLGYLLGNKIFKERSQWWNTFINEMFIFIMSILILVFSINKGNSRLLTVDQAHTVGLVFIGALIGNMVYNGLFAFFIIGKIIVNFCKKRKAGKNSGSKKRIGNRKLRLELDKTPEKEPRDFTLRKNSERKHLRSSNDSTILNESGLVIVQLS